MANEGWFSGRVAFYEPLPHPKVARQRAKRAAFEAHMALSPREPGSEEKARAAIEQLVDAFLVDREGNADCFAQAHRLGRDVSERFGCPMRLENNGRHWVRECGILALHSRLGSSPGGVTFGKCSICGAPDFGCDHIPGETYDGLWCHRLIVEWDVHEVSLTPFPKDPRCYRTFFGHPVEEVERARGRPLRRSEVPLCNHCDHCPGLGGPSPEDIDRRRWDRDLANRIPPDAR